METENHWIPAFAGMTADQMPTVSRNRIDPVTGRRRRPRINTAAQARVQYFALIEEAGKAEPGRAKREALAEVETAKKQLLIAIRRENLKQEQERKRLRSINRRTDWMIDAM